MNSGVLRLVDVKSALAPQAPAAGRPLGDDRGDLEACVRQWNAWCRRAAALHRVEVTRTGLMRTGPSIVVANHVSWLDPLVLGTIVSGVPLAKIEISQWPVVGALARRCGTIFVRRGDGHSGARALLQARAALRRGISVIVFPEGTTTARDAPLAPLHRGIFGLAQRLRTPVVPIGLRWRDDAVRWVGADSFIPHALRTLARGPLHVDVRVGAPLPMPRGAPLGPLVQAARDALGMLSDSAV